MNLNGIENYIYKNELGFGCFSYVSLAQNKHNKQLYAIKCFQLEKEIPNHHIPSFFYILNYASVISENEFKKEVYLHTLFNSKGIGPKLYANWIENGLGYMILEVWDRVLEIGDSISETHISKLKTQLHIIHQSKYVHLDVKLDNILIKVDNQDQIIDITLTDFGLMPVHIEKVKDSGHYLLICKKLGCDPKQPSLVDMKLLEKAVSLLNTF